MSLFIQSANALVSRVAQWVGAIPSPLTITATSYDNTTGGTGNTIQVTGSGSFWLHGQTFQLLGVSNSLLVSAGGGVSVATTLMIGSSLSNRWNTLTISGAG